MADNTEAKEQSYLEIRRALDEIWQKSRLHVAAYQALKGLLMNAGGAVMIFGADYKPDQVENTPIDVGLLTDMPRACMDDLITSRLEHHKLAIQQCDQGMATLMPKLLATYQRGQTQTALPVPTVQFVKPHPFPQEPSLSDLAERAAAFADAE
jgi:hypothetical protein